MTKKKIVKELVIYNGADKEIDYKLVNISNSNEIGIHCGTLKAAKARYSIISKLTLRNYNIYVIDKDIISVWSSPKVLDYIKFLNDEQKEQVKAELRKVTHDKDKYKKYSDIIRKLFLDNNYNLIKYKNEIEDKNSISYIILDTKIIKTQEVIEKQN